MTSYQRIFGTGPRGIAISFALLGLAWHLDQLIMLPPITNNDAVRLTALVVGIFVALIIAVASFRAMRPQDRGKQLVTSGIYRYLRHPLYASFLSAFNFGLAIYLNDWLYLGWALLLHPLWHWNVTAEERLMAKTFPDYPDYAVKTGRFLPRL